VSAFLLYALFLINFQFRDADLVFPQPTDGVFDLQDVDFNKNQAHVEFMYQFYPGDSSSPAELEGVTPLEYNDSVSGVPSAMFRCTILLATNDPVYIQFMVPGHSGRLFVNGRLMDGNLPFGRDTEVGYPHYYKTIMIPEDNRLDIVISAKAFDDGTYNWSYIKISDPGMQARFENRFVMLDAFYVGAHILAFMLFFILFFLLGKKPENIYFSLLCLMIALRRCVASTQLIYLVSPDFPFIIIVEHLTMCLIVPFIALYMSRVYPGLFQKPMLVGIVTCYALYAALIAVTDYHFYSSFINFFYVVSAVTFLYIIVRFFYTQRKLALEQLIALTGFLTISLAFVNDLLYFLGIYQRNGIGFYLLLEQAMLIFVLMQMVSLFLSNARTTAEAQQARQQLALENTLIANQARVREELVHDLTHEVSTPLTVISTYSQLVIRQFKQGKLDEQMIEGLEAVNGEALRISKLVSKVLKPSEDYEKTVDLSEIVQQLARLFMPVLAAAGRELNVSLTRRLFASGNAEEITQVVWNLLDNAVKHSSGNIDVDGNMNNEHVYLIVTDYGEGIPANLLSRIFERGVSDGGGMGLGLAIASEIIQKHGGRIIIESEPMMGTEVTVLLPINTGEENPANNGTAARPPAL